MINITQAGFGNCQLYLAFRTLRKQCFVVGPYTSDEEYRLINKSMKYPPLTSPAIVANPIIYRLVPSPSRFETRQWRQVGQSVSGVISFKLFLLEPGREKQKCLNVFPSTLQKIQKPAVGRKPGRFNKWWTETMLRWNVCCISLPISGISMQCSLIKSSTIFS